MPASPMMAPEAPSMGRLPTSTLTREPMTSRNSMLRAAADLDRPGAAQEDDLPNVVRPRDDLQKPAEWCRLPVVTGATSRSGDRQ